LANRFADDGSARTEAAAKSRVAIINRGAKRFIGESSTATSKA
jgi:hypothetical protein